MFKRISWLTVAGILAVSLAGPSALEAGSDEDKEKKDFGVNTGPLPADCVKFEDDEIGVEGITKTVDGVPITLYDWVAKDGEPGEFIGFSFTVEGAVFEFSVKCSLDIFEGTEGTWIHPNGTAGPTVNAISNIVFCPGDGGGDSSPTRFSM